MRILLCLALVATAPLVASVASAQDPVDAKPIDPKTLGLRLPVEVVVESANRVDPATITLDLRLGEKPAHAVLRSNLAGEDPMGGSWQAVFGRSARVDVTCRPCSPEELVRLKDVASTIAEQGAPLVGGVPIAAGADDANPAAPRTIHDHRLPIPLAVIVALGVLWALVHLLLGLVRGLQNGARAGAIGVAGLALLAHLVMLLSARGGYAPAVLVFSSASVVVAVLSAAAVLGVRAAAVVAVALLVHPFARDARVGLHASLVLALVPAAIAAVWRALNDQRSPNRVAAGLLVGAIPWAASSLWPLSVGLLLLVLVDAHRAPLRTWVGPMVLALAAAVPPALLSLREGSPPQGWDVALRALLVPVQSGIAGSVLLAAWVLSPLFLRREDERTEPFRLALVLTAALSIAACVGWTASALVGAVVPLALALGVVASSPGPVGLLGTVVALGIALMPLLARFGGQG